MSQPSNPVAITAATSNGVADSYIVLLKEECDQPTHVDWVRGLQERHRSATSTCDLTHEYQVIKGYSAVLKGAALEEVTRRSDVEAIIQDNIMVHDSIPGDEPEQDDGERGYEEARAEETGAEDLATAGGGRFTVFVQRNAPWGLQRVSDRNRLPAGSNPNKLNYKFRFSQALHPTPTDVYVLDTGVFIQHQDFGGRARWGKTFTGTPDRDIYGHGTHVAGTIAGIRWGASKHANIIAVKVLGDKGSGPTSGIIAGIDWAVQNARTTRRASVINMSLGGSPNAALDQASTNAVRAGLHVCVSAGNKNVDARNQSPARALDVFTVGATTIADARSDFSNFGPALEIFAPGSAITSAGIKSKTAHVQKSGTSMASPHVAGVIAYLIYLEGNRDHAGMLARLKALGVPNVLTGVPQDTVNLLLDNGVPSQVAVRH